MTKFEEFVLRMVPDLKRDFPGAVNDDAYAVLGNMGWESNGLKDMQELKPIGGGKGGYGGFQWTGVRRTQFLDWCKARGFSPDSYEGTYSFLVWELKNTEKKTMPRVMAASTLYNKVVAFELAFERANPKYKAYSGRLGWANTAKKFYEGFKAPEPKPPVPVIDAAPPVGALPINDPLPQHPDPAVEPAVPAWVGYSFGGLLAAIAAAVAAWLGLR